MDNVSYSDFVVTNSQQLFNDHCKSLAPTCVIPDHNLLQWNINVKVMNDIIAPLNGDDYNKLQENKH